jgi:hypothetical protein
MEALEGINRGLTDVEAGCVTPLRQFESKFREKRGLPGRSREMAKAEANQIYDWVVERAPPPFPAPTRYYIERAERLDRTFHRADGYVTHYINGSLDSARKAMEGSSDFDKPRVPVLNPRGQ